MANPLMKPSLLALIACSSLFVLARCAEQRLPSLKSLHNPTAKEPVQTMLPEGSAKIELDYEGSKYVLTPRADYILEGLIVSTHRADSWLDTMHLYSGDFLNSRDFCITWGSVLNSGLYRKVKFWSGDWTCYFQASTREDYIALKPNEVANNHVLAKDPAIRDALDRIERGDEVRIRGKLVDYSLNGIESRKSSLVRDDTGNGACETLYVESVEVIKSHALLPRLIRIGAYWGAVLALLTIVGLMLRAVFGPVIEEKFGS